MPINEFLIGRQLNVPVPGLYGPSADEKGM